MEKMRWLGALPALAFLSCAPSTQFVAPPRETREVEGALDARYSKYGAYYISDETRIEFSVLNAPIVGISPFGSAVVFKRLKVLNSESTEYGTLAIEGYSLNIPKFRVSIASPDGDSTVLPSGPLLAEYRKTGKIAVPRVKAGSVITVEIHFSLNRVLPAFEVWLGGNLPVARARFTLSALDDYDYDAKEYGGLREPDFHTVPKALSSFRVHAWKMDHVLPQSRVGLKSASDQGIPRVSLVLRKFRTQDIYTDWEKMAGQYQKQMLRKSLFAGSRRLRALGDSLAKSAPEGRKFDAAYAWVQRRLRVTQRPLRAIEPDAVIRDGEGNMWEIAVVLRDLWESMGAECDIAVTRPRHVGGFDPDFITPAVLSVPLVVLNGPGIRRVAFPYAKGAGLGEYPVEYFGLKALSLNNLDVVSLPPSVSASGSGRYAFTVHSGDAAGRTELRMELGGYTAFSFRRALADNKSEEIKESFQKYLSGMSKSNALDSVSIDGLESPGAPLKVRLVFRNGDAWIERKGDRILRLNHLFDAYFDSWDSTRTSPVAVYLPETIQEEVRLVGHSGNLKVDFRCQELDTDLFKQTCFQEGAGTLRRSVEIKPGNFSPSKARELIPRIAELNDSRSSSFMAR